MNIYLAELEKALRHTTIPDFSSGASGYFSKPQLNLDPALFEGDTVRPKVSEHVCRTLFRFWKGRGYHSPEAWATVWLAGSGITYQWAGDRGNGDLDTIIGIDWPVFYEYNPHWGHVGIGQVTEALDNELRQRLWPRTAHTQFGDRSYELTYYVNQDATDIRTINPYAAYNLSTNTWTVRPPEYTAFSDDPGTPTWHAYSDRDKDLADNVWSTVVAGLEALRTVGVNRENILMYIEDAVNQGVRLLEDIHGSRRNAFGPQGHGYMDFNNWRWQMAKKNGLVAVLGAIEQAKEAATEAAERSLYGGPLVAADQILMRAAFQHREP